MTRTVSLADAAARLESLHPEFARHAHDVAARRAEYIQRQWQLLRPDEPYPGRGLAAGAAVFEIDALWEAARELNLPLETMQIPDWEDRSDEELVTLTLQAEDRADEVVAIADPDAAEAAVFVAEAADLRALIGRDFAARYNRAFFARDTIFIEAEARRVTMVLHGGRLIRVALA